MSLTSLVPQRANVRRWLDKKISKLDTNPKSPENWDPVIQEFLALVEGDPVLCMDCDDMFKQIPDKSRFDWNPEEKPQVRDYKHMLALFDHILTCSPEWENNSMVCYPMQAILDWTLHTTAGQAVFSNPEVNSQLRKVFNVWAEYLNSSDSTYVLTKDDNGWLSPSAIVPDFEETFVCDPTDAHYGYKSWDDFFTRRFRPGARPVAEPENDGVITGACEAIVYRISKNVQAKDKFWLKTQPYSLEHMFNRDPLTPLFVGGTVFQAYLTSKSYHRWHSPVSGVVVKIIHIPGSYFRLYPTEISDDRPDDLGQTVCSHASTRVLIFVEAEDPRVGLMCIMAVGMVEVSTCEVTVQKDVKIRKGEEIGTFHFGGSTYCLVFRPETKLEFFVKPGELVLLNTRVACVV
ncbi:phosphatidylserine decarboxylase-like protein [Marasmius fiardii PR-910]|nr:phosphatidylserine decarboxylase-like protein [Marasmius fiardii PR-910]